MPEEMPKAGDVTVGTDLTDSPVLPSLFNDPSVVTKGAGKVAEELVTKIEDTPLAPPPESDSQKEKRKSRIQERISRLVAQRNAKEDETAQLRDTLASVTQELNALRSQVSRLPAPQVAPPTQAKSEYSFLSSDDAPAAGSPASQPPPSSPDWNSAIEAAVNRALKPILGKAQETAEESARQAKHQQVFAEIAQEYPELNDTSSEMRQVFNQIYDSRADLRQQDDAPLIVAHMARGILADQRRSEQLTATRKMAAAVHVPTVTTTDEIPEGGLNRSQRQAVQEAKDRLKNGNYSFNDYKLLRLAGMKQTR